MARSFCSYTALRREDDEEEEAARREEEEEEEDKEEDEEEDEEEEGWRYAASKFPSCGKVLAPPEEDREEEEKEEEVAKISLIISILYCASDLISLMSES